MHMSSEGLLVILFVGLVAGWLAGQIVQGTGFGIIGDHIVGILGAFIHRKFQGRLVRGHGRAVTAENVQSAGSTLIY